MLSSRMPSERSDAARTVRAAGTMPSGHASAGIEKERMSAPWAWAARSIMRWYR